MPKSTQYSGIVKKIVLKGTGKYNTMKKGCGEKNYTWHMTRGT